MTASSRSRRSAARTFAPPVAWTCLVLLATSLPGTAVPDMGPAWIDVVVHFGLYLVLTALWGTAARRSRCVARGRDAGPGGVGLGWLLVPVLAIFAGLDELHQAWIPGRFPSPADWVADLAGIAVGTWLESRRAGRNGSERVTNPFRRSRDGG